MHNATTLTLVTFNAASFSVKTFRITSHSKMTSSIIALSLDKVSLFNPQEPRVITSFICNHAGKN